MLNLPLCDSSSVLESLAVEEDDDVGWLCRWRLASFFFAGEEESVDEESESSPIVETFRFLHFFFLFITLLWDSCFLLARKSFSSFLCLFWLTEIRLRSPLSLFSQSCTAIDLSPESLSTIKIFSAVEYGILMGLLKILKRRYLVYDNLSSFCISGQN